MLGGVWGWYRVEEGLVVDRGVVGEGGGLGLGLYVLFWGGCSVGG